MGAFDNLNKNNVKKKTTGVGNEIEIDIAKVYPNPNQPRKTFNDEKVKELAFSIKKDGLWQAIIVNETDLGFMIVGGEYRYKAHLEAELKTIRCHIRKLSDKEIREISFKENELREDLLPIERAYAIVEMWQSGEYKTKSDIAESLCKSQSYVSKCLSVLNLGETIIDRLFGEAPDVGLEILSELASVQDADMRLQLFEDSANREEIREAKKEFKKPVVYKPKVFPFTESVVWEDIEDAIKKCGDKCEIIVREVV